MLLGLMWNGRKRLYRNVLPAKNISFTHLQIISKSKTYNHKVVAAFWGMHVSLAKYSYV